MFTGLVEDTGTVISVSPTPSGERVVVRTAIDVKDVKLRDSIAVDGVCLTVVDIGAGSVAFDVGPETLKVTAFRGVIKPNRRVHLERALRLADRLGGHLVAGHVDATGTVIARELQGDALFLAFAAPASIMELCVPKGSIAIDGVSLTLNGVNADSFDVCLIPHTLSHTHLGDLTIGDVVNLESDMIGKYVKRLLAPHTARAE